MYTVVSIERFGGSESTEDNTRTVRVVVWSTTGRQPSHLTILQATGLSGTRKGVTFDFFFFPLLICIVLNCSSLKECVARNKVVFNPLGLKYGRQSFPSRHGSGRFWYTPIIRRKPPAQSSRPYHVPGTGIGITTT
jgi:hypothetical protein